MKEVGRKIGRGSDRKRKGGPAIKTESDEVMERESRGGGGRIWKRLDTEEPADVQAGPHKQHPSPVPGALLIPVPAP